MRNNSFIDTKKALSWFDEGKLTQSEVEQLLSISCMQSFEAYEYLNNNAKSFTFDMMCCVHEFMHDQANSIGTLKPLLAKTTFGAYKFLYDPQLTENLMAADTYMVMELLVKGDTRRILFEKLTYDCVSALVSVYKYCIEHQDDWIRQVNHHVQRRGSLSLDETNEIQSLVDGFNTNKQTYIDQINEIPNEDFRTLILLSVV